MAEREKMKMNGHQEAALILGAGQRKVISFVCFGRLAVNMTPAVTGPSLLWSSSTGLHLKPPAGWQRGQQPRPSRPSYLYHTT